jgi:hypothetical protein
MDMRKALLILEVREVLADCNKGIAVSASSGGRFRERQVLHSWVTISIPRKARPLVGRHPDAPQGRRSFFSARERKSGDGELRGYTITAPFVKVWIFDGRSGGCSRRRNEDEQIACEDDGIYIEFDEFDPTEY